MATYCLLGYGKMGNAIASILSQHKENQVLIINSQTDPEQRADLIHQSDVVIEFSRPELALSHIHEVLQAKKPIVVGTTGWQHELPQIREWARIHEGAMVYASNFSIGVNLFFSLNKFLAKLMNNEPSYRISMEEIHHTQKLDSPSGTAISTAQDIIHLHSGFSAWKETNDLQFSSSETIPIHAVRHDAVIGTHTVLYKNEIDQISIKHEAFNRSGFAQGAIVAANWIQERKGIFTMEDVLSLHQN
ncbi:MAG TPA: 4-hydroxy-tetrahydrodipicolinate reductase [Saprospiraceae bacterium]|nr:4-hydroxy-tetrahydrodipicolinate reductase [Saprospiraceae bacterium]